MWSGLLVGTNFEVTLNEDYKNAKLAFMTFTASEQIAKFLSCPMDKPMIDHYMLADNFLARRKGMLVG